MRGEIKSKETVYSGEVVGDADDDNGHKYELIRAEDGHPLVCSNQTGKFFDLPWCDLLDMAVEAGIDKEN